MLAALALLLHLVAPAAAPVPLPASARELLDGAQTERSRACFDIVLPKPAAAPTRYTVELLAEYGEWVQSSSILELERSSTGATVRETTHEGVREAVLSPEQREQLDRWAAIALELSRAQQRDKDTCFGGFAFASHVASRTLALRDGTDTLLSTEPSQALEPSLENGLQAMRISWTVRTLEHLVQQWLLDVAFAPMPTDEARATVRRLPARGRGKGRAAILARLAAATLGASTDRKSVELLRRKGFDEDALRLDLRTTAAARLPVVAAPLLCSGDFVARSEAFAALAPLGAAAQAPLLHALRCTKDEWFEVEVLRRVAALPGNADVRKAIDDATASTRPQRVQVVAHALRFAAGGAEDDLAFVERIASGASGPLTEMSEPQRVAWAELVAMAGRQAELRPRVAALAATTLERIDLAAHATYSGMSLLVDAIGRFDAATHDRALRRVLAHDDASVVAQAISAIASHDLEGGAREARRRLELYLRGHGGATGYSWYVLPFLPLWVRADDREALPLLRKALPRLREGGEADPWRLGAHAATVQYLAVKGASARAAAALEFVRSHGAASPALRSALRDRLAADGVDDRALDEAAAEFDRRVRTWPTPW
ncbi:MAG: hypothetical protein U0168_04000 [Nannocystaceae bacterium]